MILCSKVLEQLKKILSTEVFTPYGANKQQQRLLNTEPEDIS